MMGSAEYVTDHRVETPGWYAVRGDDLLAGPFQSSDEADWWLDKALTI